MAEIEVSYPFSEVRFPREGSASTVLFATSRRRNVAQVADKFRVMSFDPVTETFESLGSVLTTDVNPSQNTPTAASLSEKGISLAVTGRSATQVYGLRRFCKANDVRFRLSIQLDSNPQAISWSVAEIGTIFGSVVTNRVYRSCPNCYMNGLFARTIVAEQLCLPRNQTNCFQFSFLDDMPPFESYGGYNAFFIQASNSTPRTANVTELATGVGYNVTKNVVIGETNPECKIDVAPVSCPGTQKVFLLSLLFDNYPGETEWEVTRPNGVAALSGGNYTEEMAARPIRDVSCLPTNRCFTFTIRDSQNDGLCCNNGYGEYVGFFNGVEVFRGGRFNSDQSHLFGNCP
eukprot:CAMPEP_0116562564 /NCGR_PEP_ID=MMETSP0397-20121206/12225_1 /TAXON_ID=216820 /ORGANISM="Cyclophora tenuis, Strain ECT3854" /LENGTH=345 /DNA_ID=CAMNT_0004088865 /DNA_START=334 /DNA_END=1371 /DNA_ORIENTATION=+